MERGRSVNSSWLIADSSWEVQKQIQKIAKSKPKSKPTSKELADRKTKIKFIVQGLEY